MTEDRRRQVWRVVAGLCNILALMAVLFGVGFALPGRPVAQMYAFAAVSITFMMFTTWRTMNATSAPSKRGAFQFSLRTLLAWNVPYAAVAIWIATWTGLFKEDFLNANIKAGSLIILTQVWSYAYLGMTTRSARRNL